MEPRGQDFIQVPVVEWNKIYWYLKRYRTLFICLSIMFVVAVFFTGLRFRAVERKITTLEKKVEALEKQNNDTIVDPELIIGDLELDDLGAAQIRFFEALYPETKVPVSQEEPLTEIELRLKKLHI